jgi:hypothetical protein
MHVLEAFSCEFLAICVSVKAYAKETDSDMQKDGISSGFLWLGIIAGALSSVNALNSFLDFGFKGIWRDITQYYSDLTSPFRDLIERIFVSFDVPVWMPDIVILYFVLVLAGIRATVLPFRSDEYFNAHNVKRVYKKTVPRQNDEDFDAFLARQADFSLDKISSATTKDDHFDLTMLVLFSRRELVIINILKSITLFPVITLEPYRKTDTRFNFAKNMLKKSKNNEMFISEGDGKAVYSRWYLQSEKIKYQSAIQIISLPLIVVIFILTGTYIS